MSRFSSLVAQRVGLVPVLKSQKSVLAYPAPTFRPENYFILDDFAL
jgi:hypothetical protein